MLSAGLPENLGGRGVGEVEGVGWLSVPWGEVKKKNYKNVGRGVQLHLAHPSGTVLPHKKSSELGG